MSVISIYVNRTVLSSLDHTLAFVLTDLFLIKTITPVQVKL